MKLESATVLLNTYSWSGHQHRGTIIPVHVLESSDRAGDRHTRERATSTRDTCEWHCTWYVVFCSRAHIWLTPLYIGLFQTEMTAPGTADAVGLSHIPEDEKQDFEVPATQPPVVPEGKPPYGGSVRDMGSLALFLVGNWFVNGETVLIDGGVCTNHEAGHDMCSPAVARRCCCIHPLTENLRIRSDTDLQECDNVEERAPSMNTNGWGVTIEFYFSPVETPFIINKRACIVTTK